MGVDIKDIAQPTLEAVYEAWKKRGNTDNGHRCHLGASILGHECSRALWYGFHWCTDQEHEGRLLRLFDRGHLEEDRFVSELKWAGIEIHDIDSRTGEQFRFSDCGGHVGGSMDGVGIGFLESPTKWHVVEFKTHGDKSFNLLKSKGVKESKPEHFAQMQLYMHWSGLKDAFYMAVNKNNDELYSERIKYSESFCSHLLKKAWDIVKSEKPLEKMTENPTFYKCTCCAHSDICHKNQLPAVNCRTCLHATPEIDEKGTWTCALKNIELSEASQRAGCSSHLYIPDFVNWAKVVDGSKEGNWVEYEKDGKRFRNGEKGDQSYPSIELREESVKDFLGDEFVDYLRDQFGAAFSDPEKSAK